MVGLEGVGKGGSHCYGRGDARRWAAGRLAGDKATTGRGVAGTGGYQGTGTGVDGARSARLALSM